MTEHYREASFIAFQMGNGRPAIFVLRQVLRPMVGDTLALLRQAGLSISILSGDRENAVRPIAEELAISTYQSGLAPAQKIAHIEKLKADGSKVLMVGDGLNDAPALAAAHVSMSPVSAVHLAQSAADAVFMGQSLRPVADAVTIAKRARSAMVQNLALAAAYNMLAVPFAVAGFVTPLTAAIAMSASSLIVTANALRLRLTRQAGETAESETPSAVANPLPAE
jgi:Cu2+-exporting ATPase